MTPSFHLSANEEWAERVSENFRTYFTTLAEAKGKFIDSVQKDKFEHVANVATMLPVSDDEADPV